MATVDIFKERSRRVDRICDTSPFVRLSCETKHARGSLPRTPSRAYSCGGWHCDSIKFGLLEKVDFIARVLSKMRV